MLMDTYHAAADALLKRVRDTQRENIIKAGSLLPKRLRRAETSISEGSFTESRWT